MARNVPSINSRLDRIIPHLILPRLWLIRHKSHMPRIFTLGMGLVVIRRQRDRPRCALLPCQCLGLGRRSARRISDSQERKERAEEDGGRFCAVPMDRVTYPVRFVVVVRYCGGREVRAICGNHGCLSEA